MKRITRREFVAAVGIAGITAGAHAQQGTGEGHEFRSVKPPAPSEAPAGKVEVIEFFWYGCPHCFAFEPILENWTRGLAADVAATGGTLEWGPRATGGFRVTALVPR